MAKRWPLYLAICAGVYGLQAAFLALQHGTTGDLYASFIGPPLVIAVVTVYVASDATGKLQTSGQRWLRILDRAWAVILIDVGLTFIGIVSIGHIQAPGAAIGDVLFGVSVLMFSAMLLYAEPFACIEDDVALIWIVPLALARSVSLACADMSRIFALFGVELALALAGSLLVTAASAAGLRNAQTLVFFPFVTFTSAPFAALIAVAYLDSSARAQRSAAP